MVNEPQLSEKTMTSAGPGKSSRKDGKDGDVDHNQKRSDGRKREKRHELPQSKVIIRHLPPTMTEQQFMEQIWPVPDNNYFYFAKADMSLGPYAFTRAYINFKRQDDIFTFKDKFDDYVFVDSKGNEYPAVVEFAPYPRVPRGRYGGGTDKLLSSSKKRDIKCGTIEEDQDYVDFLKTLEESKNEPNLPSAEVYLPEMEIRDRELRANKGCPKIATPLTEYLGQRYAKRDLKKRKVEHYKPKQQDRKQQEKLREENEWNSKRSADRVGGGVKPEGFKGKKDNHRDRKKQGDKRDKNKEDRAAGGEFSGILKEGAAKDKEGLPVVKKVLQKEKPKEDPSATKSAAKPSNNIRYNKLATDGPRIPHVERKDATRRPERPERQSTEKDATRRPERPERQSTEKDATRRPERPERQSTEKDGPAKSSKEVNQPASGGPRPPRPEKKDTKRPEGQTTDKVKNKDRPERAIYRPGQKKGEGSNDGDAGSSEGASKMKTKVFTSTSRNRK